MSFYRIDIITGREYFFSPTHRPTQRRIHENYFGFIFIPHAGGSLLPLNLFLLPATVNPNGIPKKTIPGHDPRLRNFCRRPYDRHAKPATVQEP